jgi:hypothetical protein
MGHLHNQPGLNKAVAFLLKGAKRVLVNTMLKDFQYKCATQQQLNDDYLAGFTIQGFLVE